MNGKMKMAVMYALAGIALFLFAGGLKLKDALKGGVESGVNKAVTETVEQAVYKKLAPKNKLPPPKST